MSGVHLQLPQTLSGLIPNPTTAGQDVWVLLPTKANLSPPQEPPVSAPHGPEPVSRNHHFVRRGSMWDLQMGSNQVLLRHRKGYTAIALLLQRPRDPIPATALLAAMDGVDVRHFAGTRGEIMTVSALDDLRRRAQDLKEELGEARMRSDDAGEEHILTELTAIAEAIHAAQGKGGKGRKLSDADKVRVRMTNMIKRCIWTISQENQAFGSYLTATIRTGHQLVYQPRADESWVVQTRAA